MTRIRGFTVLLALSATAWSSEYTLEQLLEIGFKNSKDLRAVDIEMVKTDAQIRQAYGSALPEISATVSLQHAFAQYNPLAGGGVDTAAMNRQLRNTYDGISNGMTRDTLSQHVLRATGPIISGVTMGQIAGMFPESYDNALVAGLSLKQPIFAQGKVGIGLKIAKLYKATLVCKYDAARQKLKGDITKLFYAVLLSNRMLEIRREAVRLAQETHRLAVLRLSVGKGTEIDTLSTRLGLEKARIDVRDAEGSQRTTAQALIQKVGITDTPQALAVAGVFPQSDYTISLEQALDNVKKNNKTLGQLKGTDMVQEQLVRLQKSDYLPMVAATASVGKLGQFNEFDNIQWSDDQKVGVALLYTLFNGGQRSQKVKQAQADRRNFQISMQTAEEGLELATRSAFESLETSREKLASARALVTLAEKGYQLSNKAYEIGSMTLTELQQRELDLNQARMALSAAQFGFHSAVIDLRLLMGDLPVTLTENIQ